MGRLLPAVLFGALTYSLIMNTPRTLNATSDHLTITLYPHVILADTAVWLTCHVPSRPENRLLAYGIAQFYDAERDLDGEDALATWKVLIDHIPCHSGPAYCVVTRADDSYERVTANLLVSGCE